jgi:dihydroorotase
MMDFVKKGRISIERAVEKLSHAPAICFHINKRGFIRKGYFADLVLVDLNASQTVEKSNLLYKCGWSPFEGHTFSSLVDSTFVNGRRVFHQGKFNEEVKGQAITFDR